MSGGKREGAGRPEAVQPSMRVSFRFLPATLERLDAIGVWMSLDRTKSIEHLIEDYFLRLAVSAELDRVKRGDE